MEYLAYNYFETPKEASVFLLASALIRSDFEISNAGKNDPPKKFSGSANELCALIKAGTAPVNYTFLKSRKDKISITIHDGWSHSTFSISGPDKKMVEVLCLSLNSVVNSHLCLSGILGGGPDQEWLFLHKSSTCPEFLLEKICQKHE